jgi:hypothetical protein
MKRIILLLSVFAAVILCMGFGLYKLAGLEPEQAITAEISETIPDTSENIEEKTESTHVSATSSDVHFTNKNRKSGELESLMYDIAEKTKG